MNTGSPGITNIIDLPHEILVKILLYFNARERLSFAKICAKFKDLVLGDMELLRNLVFSPNGWLTTFEDIRTYFINETGNKFIRKVNISSVICMGPGEMLNSTIGKGVNLVDVDIMGIRFSDVRQLGSFLELLIHLKRLTIDWPDVDEDVGQSIDVLQTPLSRLNYLAVKVRAYSNFFPTVHFSCKELVELCIIAFPGRAQEILWPLYSHNKLQNLKIVQVHSGHDCLLPRKIYRGIVRMLPDLCQWTFFQVSDTEFEEEGFYLEKSVEICDELLKTRVANVADNFPVIWSVLSESLLQEAISLTHENVPRDFCCLETTDRNASPMPKSRRFILKIEEAKRLLKDPGYQISFLNLIEHQIEAYCDVHLVGSAFPNLRCLGINKIATAKEGSERTKCLLRRLTRRGGGAPEALQDEPSGNRNYSFKILVENTPLLRELTIFYTEGCDSLPEVWDFDALFHIAQWRNLTVLHLTLIPIQNGRFLIHIGIHCPNLEKLVLKHLNTARDCTTYGSDLAEMLTHCRNIKEFTFDDNGVVGLLELLTSLTHNLKLERIDMDGTFEEVHVSNLIASIHRLLLTCTMLNKFKFVIIWTKSRKFDKNYLITQLRRIRGELNRPEFQFQVVDDDKLKDGDDFIHEERLPWYEFNLLS